jgi:four helix bundle protein
MDRMELEKRTKSFALAAIVEKEAAETLHWLELCRDSCLGEAETCNRMLVEADELLAIFTSIGRTAKRNDRRFDLHSNPKSAIRNPK